ncbi:MAG: hypothetical protein WC156_10345 [Pedobacter sp.]
MSEAISFWLDNKIASARKIAEIGDQALVDYRGKFYVIMNGTAVMKGSKPLHYSKSSMPAIWKKAMRGEAPTVKPSEPEDDILPMASVTKRVRIKKMKEAAPMTDATPATLQQTAAPKTEVVPKFHRPATKTETKSASQTMVQAQCPYCSQKHEIPVEKGKNGKPFFITCTKCATDFAVRFVSVTIFQAQVAGFR